MDPARTGANRSAWGNQNPNGQDRRTAGYRRSRSEALTSKWWPGDGQSFRESERPLRDAGSSQESWQVSLETLIRRFRKRAAGSRRDGARRSWMQSSVPLHAGGEFSCEIGSLGFARGCNGGFFRRTGFVGWVSSPQEASSACVEASPHHIGCRQRRVDVGQLVSVVRDGGTGLGQK